MRLGKLGGLVRKNLRRNLRYHVLAGAAILVGVAAFVFFLALGEGVRERVVGRLSGDLPESELEVKPKDMSLGVLKIDRPSFLGGKRFDDAALARLRAIPGVKDLYPTMNVRFPVMAWGQFFGKGVRTDLIVTGVDERAVTEELGEQAGFRWAEGQRVPIIASPHLLELYNSSFARMNDLPRVTEELMRGLKFNFVLGKSYLAGTPDPDKVKTVGVEFVGFSRHSILLGATAPLSFVKTMNGRYAGEREASTYRSAILVAESAGQAESIARAAEALGHQVASESRDLARRVEAVVTGVTVLLSLVGLAMIGIAAVVIALTFSLTVVERRAEFGLLRAVGGTRSDVALLILAEGAVVGLAAGLLGLLAGFGASAVVDALAASQLPDFPYKPDSFFLFPAWLLAAGPLVAILCCGLGALFPARRAARLDPAAALTER